MSDFDLYDGQGCRCGNDPQCFQCGSGPAYEEQMEREQHYKEQMERQYSEELIALAPEWTPGPWRADLAPYDTWIVDGNSHPVANAVRGASTQPDTAQRANIALITLAPEMAAAILEQARRYPGCDIVKDLAEKLRAI